MISNLKLVPHINTVKRKLKFNRHRKTAEPLSTKTVEPPRPKIVKPLSPKTVEINIVKFRSKCAKTKKTLSPELYRH